MQKNNQDEVSTSSANGCRNLLLLFVTCIFLLLMCSREPIVPPLHNMLTSPELARHIDNIVEENRRVSIPTNTELDSIAFICGDAGYLSSVYTVNSDGSHLRRIHEHPSESHAELTWSPDGIWLAVIVKNQADIKWEDPTYELYRIRFDGLDSRRLTYNHYREISPQWSFDNASITYISHHGVHRVSGDGYEISQFHRKTRSVVPWISASWSYRDEVVTVDPSRPDLLLYSANPDGSDLRILKDVAGYVYGVHWAPNGEHVLYHTSTELGVLNVMSGHEEFVLSMKSISDARLSPNGKWIAILGKRDAIGRGERLHVLDADTGHDQAISESFGRIYLYGNLVSWSPDSEWIAFIKPRSYKYQLFKIKRDGTGLQQLTDLDCSISELSWSPQ